MTYTVVPFSLKDAPALIERLLPVQKLSAEAYKEQMAGTGKTLTSLGSYWKGRKPLILNKACILGCLLPATDDPVGDLEIFEMLMGMDRTSLERRLATKNDKNSRYFLNEGEISVERNALYREWVQAACRPEECGDSLYDGSWEAVNGHLGTDAHSFPELIEQLGVMRFGHRPQVADTFCGSGQIPFEAARLGCNVYASDLNPIACMLTWGAFNIVGGAQSDRKHLMDAQARMVARAETEIARLGIEDDGNGWRGKIYLYCLEVRCPETGWLVPMLPNRILNRVRSIVLDLVPDPVNQRYEIVIRTGVSASDMAQAHVGTVQADGRGQDPYLVHSVNGTEYRTKLSTLRGDYRLPDGSIGNRLRLWDKNDFKPRPDDIYQERLYAVQWMRPSKSGRGEEYQVRAVSEADLQRERIIESYLAEHFADWQAEGWLPDMRIEMGVETTRLFRERGWTHWHHLFNPRQLLVGGLLNQFNEAALKLGFARMLNCNSRLSRFTIGGSGAAMVTGVFDNQALNTLINYGCRGMRYALDIADADYKTFRFDKAVSHRIGCHSAEGLADTSEIYVTDPPYGDAVNYEEILEFFIAWLRKNPPPEFADWVWDSRRSLAVKGEGEDFRRNMVAAYKRMTECMPDNGLQVIMFTHQSGSIWADMANIVWASGLQVTAAWYVVTETNSALRGEDSSHVKGTVLLVCRKRLGTSKTTSDELAWEIQEQVEEQVRALTGLNQEAKGLYRDENVFEDADIQMAGYAAALRVLTRYAIIDGRDMTGEAIRPRVKGEETFVDSLITFAVNTANQCLVPQGISKGYWDKLSGVERFYLKMLDMEARGFKTLDNYQNFAKAFKVNDYRLLLASQKANNARLKGALDFGRAEMNEGSELYGSVLRAALYAMLELMKNVDGHDVLTHLTYTIPNYFSDQTQREHAMELADYLARRLDGLHPEEASAARVLRELLMNHRPG